MTNESARYPVFASRSLYSLARSNPGVRVRLLEGSPPSYAYDILPGCIPADEPDSTFVIVMDADTWVNGRLQALLPRPGEDISLRVANVWNNGLLHREEWQGICDHFAVPYGPVYSNGIMACRGSLAAYLRRDLSMFTAIIRQQGALGNIVDPLHLRKRPPWWMSDQFALSILIAEQRWIVRPLDAQHISWNYRNERGGVVHHLGKNEDPLAEDRWSKYKQAVGDAGS